LTSSIGSAVVSADFFEPFKLICMINRAAARARNDGHFRIDPRSPSTEGTAAH